MDESNTRQGRVFWLTGLPASGKTTLARGLLESLIQRGQATLWLDSDALREVITPNPTYSPEERDIFYGTIGYLAKVASQGGVTVVISATAPKARYRDALRAQVTEFVEVWLQCPPETCKQRDPKGLYSQSAAGEIDQLPGAGVEYEAPTAPELKLDSGHVSPIELVDHVLRFVDARDEK